MIWHGKNDLHPNFSTLNLWGILHCRVRLLEGKEHRFFFCNWVSTRVPIFFWGGKAAWLGEVFQKYFILALRRAKGWIGVASLMASQEVRSTQMFWGHLRFSCPPSHSRCEMTIGCSCDKTSVTNYGIYMYLRELMCFLSEPTWKFGRVWQHWSCCKCFLLCGFFCICNMTVSVFYCFVGDL